jgi:hypothetical protein
MKKLCGMVLLLALGSAWAEEAPPFFLSVKDNTLSAKIENAPLGEILRELAHQAQLEVYLGGSIAEEQISTQFDNLPLEDGIKRLLKGKNYTLTYARTAAAPRVAEIRVISNGSGPISKLSGEVVSAPPAGETEPQSPEEKSLEKLTQEVLQAPAPAARIAALEALGERGQEEKIVSTVTSALRDQDPGVRGTALELAQRGMPVPLGALHEMARQDPSRELRAQVWDELLDLSETTSAAVEYLNQALQDQDPGIKAWASRMLQRMAEEAETEAAEQ